LLLAQLGELSGVESVGAIQQKKQATGIDQQPRQSVFKISPGGRSSNYIRGDKVEQQKVIEARLQY
jgi:hypothetical protein